MKSFNFTKKPEQKKEDKKEDFLLQVWNCCRNTKKHIVKESKILTRFSELVKGKNQEEIVKAFINYDRALENKKSKLSVGSGKLFLFSIDSFFEFNDYDKKLINSNPTRKSVLDPELSLFNCFNFNPEYFDYGEEKASPEEIKTFDAILNFQDVNKSDKIAIINKLKNFLKENTGHLVLNKGEVYELVEDKKETETLENLLFYIEQFIKNVNTFRFQVYHLRHDFFYEHFIGYLRGRNRFLNKECVKRYEVETGMKYPNAPNYN